MLGGPALPLRYESGYAYVADLSRTGHSEWALLSKPSILEEGGLMLLAVVRLAAATRSVRKTLLQTTGLPQDARRSTQAPKPAF